MFDDIIIDKEKNIDPPISEEDDDEDIFMNYGYIQDEDINNSDIPTII